MSIRLLIVDDERLIRGGLQLILGAAAEVEIVGEAADGEEAVALAGSLGPDVVLMDIRMPRLDGIAATRRIVGGRRATEAGPRVIVLTTFDLDEYVYEALRAGASAFLLKDAPEEHLLAAIRVVADGGALFAPSVTRRLIERFVRQAPPADRALEALTAREQEVLRLLARGRTNREIATELVVTEHTAKSHVARILDKLDLRDRVQAVVLAYETGAVRPGEIEIDGRGGGLG